MMDIGKDLKEAYEQGYKDRDAELVRCKDCRYRKKIGTLYYCDLDEFNVKDADFCSWGERREEVNGFKSVGQAWNTSQERRYE